MNARPLLLAGAAVAGTLGLALTAPPAAAHGVGHAPYYHDRGERIERRLDWRGDVIEHRYDHAARRAARHGHYGAAVRLDRRGDRIDARLDARGQRLDRRYDRCGRVIEIRF